MAFTRTSFGSDGDEQCPRGWIPFTPAEGRMLLGHATTEYPLGSTGGQATIPAEQALPRHSHRIDTTSPRNVTDVGQTGRITTRRRLGERGSHTAATGAEGDHPNMPPYLTVSFCHRGDFPSYTANQFAPHDQRPTDEFTPDNRPDLRDDLGVWPERTGPDSES